MLTNQTLTIFTKVLSKVKLKNIIYLRVCQDEIYLLDNIIYSIYCRIDI